MFNSFKLSLFSKLKPNIWSCRARQLIVKVISELAYDEAGPGRLNYESFCVKRWKWRDGICKTKKISWNEFFSAKKWPKLTDFNLDRNVRREELKVAKTLKRFYHSRCCHIKQWYRRWQQFVIPLQLVCSEKKFQPFYLTNQARWKCLKSESQSKKFKSDSPTGINESKCG